jgi:hypothetical protein
VPLQRGFERDNMAVFGIKPWVGEDKRFAAVMPDTAERFQDRLAGGGKGVRVGDQQGRFVAELLPKYLRRPAQHTLAQFQAAGVRRRAYCLRD